MTLYLNMFLTYPYFTLVEKTKTDIILVGDIA